MKIIHKLNKTIVAKNTKQDPNFLLTNKLGGYCMLASHPHSRYQGIFLFDKDMYKIIENISLVNASPVQEIVNEFSSIKRKRKNIQESFFMPYGYDALVYELNQPAEIELILDMRSSYSNPEFGREYKISRSNSKIMIDYKHGSTKLFLAIKADNLDYEKIEEWVKRDYGSDKARGTLSEKHVFRALKLKAKTVIFSFSRSRKRAIEEVDDVYKNLTRLKEHQKIYVTKINTKLTRNPEIRIAKKCCINSLNKLLVNLKNNRGLFAGLPWFFQFWSRDEIISLKALMLNHQHREVKEILLKNLNLIKNGRLLNINMPKAESTNADSIGWLFKRISDCLELFSSKDKEVIKKKLTAAIKFINENYMADSLVYNESKSTWMDTVWDKDTRAGFRIEIQALFLNMLKLAYQLTKDEKYIDQERGLRILVKERFWNGKILADGLKDFTIRPNIFIAAYIYPELLSKSEWTLCFKNILPKLWLKYGGLSTIDKSNPLFCNDYTGESNQSYHRGDSWFWINNLAALVLKRTNKLKFRSYIDKITQASVKEILTSGALGHHAEISSASRLESQGCFAQAWSNAMFVELIEEL
ncbi:MAG: amylo-alpha-1,6-glucosidase [Candidatus Woesearchaeota archaeon]